MIQNKGTNSLIALLLALSLTIDKAECQLESIGCFVTGECIQSFSAGINITNTPQECLEFCQVTQKQINVLDGNVK